MVSTLKEFAIGVCLATTTAKRQKNINEFDLYTIYAKGLVWCCSNQLLASLDLCEQFIRVTCNFVKCTSDDFNGKLQAKLDF